MASPGTRKSSDVIVIGAGVIGLATAFELQRRGLGVTVLERGKVGRGGASWAGGGILAPLDPADTHPQVRALIRDSLACYPDWCAAIHAAGGIDPEYQVCGMQVRPPLVVEHWAQLGRECGFRSAPSHEMAGALECPDVAQVRSPRLLKSLASALRAGGAQILEGQSVTDIRGDAYGHTLSTALGDRYSCVVVVVCAGAWSAALTPMASLKPVKGQMLLIDARPGELDRIVLGAGRYLIPRRDGPILAGSTVEEVGFDSAPSEVAKTSILTSAEMLMPALAGRPVLAHWTGLRPCLPQGIPRIEWLDTRPGVLLNLGHHRLGITLAPASAVIAADLVLANG